MLLLELKQKTLFHIFFNFPYENWKEIKKKSVITTKSIRDVVEHLLHVMVFYGLLLDSFCAFLFHAAAFCSCTYLFRLEYIELHWKSINYVLLKLIVALLWTDLTWLDSQQMFHCVSVVFSTFTCWQTVIYDCRRCIWYQLMA